MDPAVPSEYNSINCVYGIYIHTYILFTTLWIQILSAKVRRTPEKKKKKKKLPEKVLGSIGIYEIYIMWDFDGFWGYFIFM